MPWRSFENFLAEIVPLLLQACLTTGAVKISGSEDSDAGNSGMDFSFLGRERVAGGDDGDDDDDDNVGPSVMRVHTGLWT